uniref:Uncharacterized protein n=1 Tax=Leersia perrieri TaxID=77586 RepID=A0A0D9VZJ2_9ORYZ
MVPSCTLYLSHDTVAITAEKKHRDELLHFASRTHRSKKFRPKHGLQIFLLVAVSVWLVYQLTRSYINRRSAVAVENAAAAAGAVDGEETPSTWRRLGRKGFVDFAGELSDGDGVRGIIGGRSNVAVDEEATGEEEEGNDVYIAEDGLPGDEEDDGGGDFRPADGMDVSVGLPVNSSDDGIGVPPLENADADGMNNTVPGINKSSK